MALYRHYDSPCSGAGANGYLELISSRSIPAHASTTRRLAFFTNLAFRRATLSGYLTILSSRYTGSSSATRVPGSVTRPGLDPTELARHVLRLP